VLAVDARDIPGHEQQVSGERWFRGDINGLRALAIIPVVAFHASVPGFSGGFIGVDVFLDISG
jgi:peptidoglycan/LPS O-acetylase OafA/YrhL